MPEIGTQASDGLQHPSGPIDSQTSKAGPVDVGSRNSEQPS